MKPLLAGLAAIALLASAPVMAQSMPPGGASNPPSAQKNGSPSAGGSGIIASQDADQVLAKDLMGSPVVTPDGKKVGVVKDLIIDPQGHVTGLVIASGSFLGLGGKSVGVSASKVSIEPSPQMGSGDEKMVLVRLSARDISNAPEFKSAEERGRTPPTQ